MRARIKQVAQFPLIGPVGLDVIEGKPLRE